MTTVKEICWLAGLMEGEGCFIRRESSTVPRIGFDTTDRDIADRAALLFGVRVGERAPNMKTHYKPVYIVRVGTARAVGWMMTLYPLLGQRRRAKIRQLLGEWRIPQKRGWDSHRAKHGCMCQANTGSCQKRVHPVEAWHEGVR